MMGLSARNRWVEKHPGAGFMLAGGLFDICGGVFVFLTGAPAGWACMVIGCGAVLLAGAALIGFDIAIEPQAATLIAGIVVVVSFAIASLYLTHPAEDLPRLLPGHDVDSERLRVTYGAVSTLIACSATWIAFLSALPRRHLTL
jgi:hypothetical protein